MNLQSRTLTQSHLKNISPTSVPQNSREVSCWRRCTACNSRRLHEENQLRFSNSTVNISILRNISFQNDISLKTMRLAVLSWEKIKNRELGPAWESKSNCWSFRPCSPGVYRLDKSKIKVNSTLVSTCNCKMDYFKLFYIGMLVVRTNGRTIGRTVTWLPKLLRWMDYQIDHSRNTITYHNALCLSSKNFAKALSSVSLGS